MMQDKDSTESSEMRKLYVFQSIYIVVTARNYEVAHMIKVKAELLFSHFLHTIQFDLEKVTKLKCFCHTLLFTPIFTPALFSRDLHVHVLVALGSKVKHHDLRMTGFHSTA